MTLSNGYQVSVLDDAAVWQYREDTDDWILVVENRMVEAASKKSLGSVIVGEGFSITDDGVLSAQVSSSYDYAENNPLSTKYIANRTHYELSEGSTIFSSKSYNPYDTLDKRGIVHTQIASDSTRLFSSVYVRFTEETDWLDPTSEKLAGEGNTLVYVDRGVYEALKFEDLVEVVDSSDENISYFVTPLGQRIFYVVHKDGRYEVDIAGYMGGTRAIFFKTGIYIRADYYREKTTEPWLYAETILKKITLSSSIVKKIDWKYLPNNFVTQEWVNTQSAYGEPSDWIEEDTSEMTYIQNKPYVTKQVRIINATFTDIAPDDGTAWDPIPDRLTATQLLKDAGYGQEYVFGGYLDEYIHAEDVCTLVRDYYTAKRNVGMEIPPIYETYRSWSAYYGRYDIYNGEFRLDATPIYHEDKTYGLNMVMCYAAKGNLLFIESTKIPYTLDDGTVLLNNRVMVFFRSHWNHDVTNMITRLYTNEMKEVTVPVWKDGTKDFGWTGTKEEYATDRSTITDGTMVFIKDDAPLPTLNGNSDLQYSSIWLPKESGNSGEYLSFSETENAPVWSATSPMLELSLPTLHGTIVETAYKPAASGDNWWINFNETSSFNSPPITTEDHLFSVSGQLYPYRRFVANKAGYYLITVDLITSYSSSISGTVDANIELVNDNGKALEAGREYDHYSRWVLGTSRVHSTSVQPRIYKQIIRLSAGEKFAIEARSNIIGSKIKYSGEVYLTYLS